MLDLKVIREFLEDNLEAYEIPKDISMKDLTRTFAKYVMDDYYEWLRDNFKWFFNHGDPSWDTIRERIKEVKNEKY